MKARQGQVALYLALVLVALAVLMLMNVSAYLAVTAKNRAMNAGDSAALAAAAWQGDCLRRIGQLNEKHLKLLAVPAPDPANPSGIAEALEALKEQQARICFLEPMEGLRRANEAARQVGVTEDAGMTDLLRQHVIDVRTVYRNNPDLYPEPWEGAWEDYAQKLELIVGEGIVAGPDNIDFVDAADGHYLLMPAFYAAIAGRSWCWFFFNAQSLLNNYASFQDWPPLPAASDGERAVRCVNCEIFSLHLRACVGSAVDVFGKTLVQQLTGLGEKQIEDSVLLNDNAQVWYCYDTMDHWRDWWEIDPDGKWQFPVVGRVKDEYNVRGCAAICRVRTSYLNLVNGEPKEGESSVTQHLEWSAAAKPFGRMRDLNGSVCHVAALNGIVLPVEWQSHLVPYDAVVGKDVSTADAAWMTHVRKHLPPYMKSGLGGLSVGCYYCRQLQAWESESVRAAGRDYMHTQSSNCQRPTGSGTEHGGTPHGH